MSVTGSVEATVSFSDSADRQTKTVAKNALIDEIGDLSTAVVAIVSGTIGTVTQNIFIDPTTYRNAAGDLVTFDTTPPARIALVADGDARVTVTDNDLALFNISSSRGRVAMSDWSFATVGTGLSIQAAGGTNTYSVVLWR